MYKIRKIVTLEQILTLKVLTTFVYTEHYQNPTNLHVCHSEIYCQSKVSLKIATKVIQKRNLLILV